MLPRLTLLTLALLAGAAALAGECRTTLRPLLLQQNPDADKLAAVRKVCEREAAGGDADATYQLSFFYLGLGGNFEPDKGVPLIKDAASRDVSEAQYWMAWQSEAGPFLEHDNAVAVGWYEKAAAARHRFALQRLAEAYEKGEIGLPVDLHKAQGYRAQIRKCDEERKKAEAVTAARP